MPRTRPLPFVTARALASRLGHDALWVAIAGLFCVVEAAVKITEVIPGLRRRAVRSADPQSASRVFAR